MAGVDAARMLDKYQRRTAAAGADYVAGVQNPKRSFKTAALAANGKWKNRVQEAIQADRFAAGMNGVNEQEAIATATADGGAAYTAGVAKRIPKVQRAFQVIAPQISAVSQRVQGMPQDTPQQREQRMLANLQGMRAVSSRSGR
ncbi:MAG: hypothetical protein IVW53_15465 [Chloroflexi bacterium]|nr:hypothetical protein [Chloroflexota bacterium]